MGVGVQAQWCQDQKDSFVKCAHLTKNLPSSKLTRTSNSNAKGHTLCHILYIYNTKYKNIRYNWVIKKRSKISCSFQSILSLQSKVVPLKQPPHLIYWLTFWFSIPQRLHTHIFFIIISLRCLITFTFFWNCCVLL